MPSWLTWLIVALVVIALIVVLVVVLGRRRREQNRARAAELREQASARAPEVRDRDQEARGSAQAAAAARAEADRKRAEAEQLERRAHDQQQSAQALREEHLDQLGQADRLDPDVDTKAEDYDGPGSGGLRDHRGSGDRGDDGLLDSSQAEAAQARAEARPSTTTVTHPDGSTEEVSAGDAIHARSTDPATDTATGAHDGTAGRTGDGTTGRTGDTTDGTATNGSHVAGARSSDPETPQR